MTAKSNQRQTNLPHPTPDKQPEIRQTDGPKKNQRMKRVIYSNPVSTFSEHLFLDIMTFEVSDLRGHLFALLLVLHPVLLLHHLVTVAGLLAGHKWVIFSL